MKDQLMNIIAQVSGRDISRISDQSRFSDDLGLDSINIIEILTEVEDCFDLRFAPDEDDIGAIFYTVSSLWAHIADKKGINVFLKKIMQDVYARRNPLSEELKTVVRTERVNGGILCEVWFMTRGCCHDMEGGCVMCNYGKGMLVEHEEIIGQLRDRFDRLPQGLRELVINPSGSFLDDREVPPPLRSTILALLKDMPFQTLTVESRADVLSLHALQELKNSLDNKEIFIEIGVESLNPWLLRNCINKGLAIESIFTAVAQIHSLGMQAIANIGLGIPFISESANIIDAAASIHKAFEMGFDQVVLFPYHVKPGTLLEELYALKMYRCVSLWSLIQVLLALDGAKLAKTNISWYRNNYTNKNKVLASPTTCTHCEAQILGLLDDYRDSPGSLSLERLANLECACYEDWHQERINEPQGIVFDDVLNGYRALAKVFNVDGDLLERELNHMKTALEACHANH